jgi:hypothetical protein
MSAMVRFDEQDAPIGKPHDIAIPGAAPRAAGSQPMRSNPIAALLAHNSDPCAIRARLTALPRRVSI